METQKISKNKSDGITLPTYTQDPLFLRDKDLALTPNEKDLYRVIYHRLISYSIPNAVLYSDSAGDFFVIYTNEALARDCNLSISTVKKAKKSLVEKGFLKIRSIPKSRAVYIYPMYPKDAPTYPFRYYVKEHPSTTPLNDSLDAESLFALTCKKYLKS